MKRLTIQFKAVVFSTLLLLLLVLSGCSLIGGGGGEEESAAPPVVFGDQATLGGEATLLCSPSCSELGFCGTDPNGTTVVILNSSGPATINQDLTIPENTPVTILGVEKREAMFNTTLVPFMIDYYFVNAAENGQGWVGGWCIGQ